MSQLLERPREAAVRDAERGAGRGEFRERDCGVAAARREARGTSCGVCGRRAGDGGVPEGEQGGEGRGGCERVFLLEVVVEVRGVVERGEEGEEEALEGALDMEG